MTDQNSVQTYHLKLSFSQYEKSYLMEHLTQYQKKIQRHLPKQTITQDPPFMTSDHRLLQFEYLTQYHPPFTASPSQYHRPFSSPK